MKQEENTVLSGSNGVNAYGIGNIFFIEPHFLFVLTIYYLL
jgi:hypothetical protein